MRSTSFFIFLFTLCSLAFARESSRSLSATNPSSNPNICQGVQPQKCDFQAWKQKFEQSYETSEENDRRRAIFCQNCTLVMSHKKNYRMKLNKWVASTQTQIDHHFGLRRQDLSDDNPELSTAADRSVASMRVSSIQLPVTFDFRKLNGHSYVTSVKEQGSCGCCWSFAATAAYQSLLLLNGHDYGLSQEASLECTTAYAKKNRINDCSGGYFPDSLNFLAMVGSVLRSSYPYKATNYGEGAGTPITPGICTEQSRIFLGPGSVNIYAPYLSSGGLSVEQIKTALLTDGPLMMGMYANTEFNFYCSGLFTGCPANSAYFINHAILLVGWTKRGWIGKNQWGADWGNRGFVEIDFEYDCGMRYLLGNVKVFNKNSNPQVLMDPNYGAVSVSSSTADSKTASSWERRTMLSNILLIMMLVACF